MEQKKGLGRGLSSLLGILDDDKDVVVEHPTKEDIFEKNKTFQSLGVQEIEMSLIDRNANQPRKNFDASALNELAESIKNYGVVQPIILKEINGRYLIIAGERRFRASKIAGLKKIPAVIRDYNEQEIKEIALLENIQREDLNPIECARAMKELLESYGWTQEVLADKLGKSRSSIANTLRLLNLTPEVLQMIEDGKLSAGHAKSLVIVNDPEVQLKLAKLALSKNVTVRDMEKAVRDLSNNKATSKKTTHYFSIELKELISQMQHKFKTKVSLRGTDSKGKIVIDYYNQDDLDRIYHIVTNIK